MKYCTHCHVSCSDQHTTCPLCDVRLVDAAGKESPVEELPFFPPRKDHMPNARDKFYRRRPVYVVILSILFAVPAFVCLTVDILMSGSASWSLVVLPSLALPWTLILLALLFHDEAIPMVLAMMTAVAAYLYVLASLGGDASWAIGLAIPLVVVLALGILVLIIGIRNLAKKVFGILAVLLFVSSASAMAIDLLVNFYLAGTLSLGWGLVVLVACGPLGGLFLILEKAYERSARLRRMFHW